MKRILLSLLATLPILITNINGQVSVYSPIPYSTGFESGSLDPNWYTTSSGPDGRIQVWATGVLTWSTQTAYSHTGNYWLGLDTSPGGTYHTNQAWMGLNATGASGVRMSFWWGEWNDETEAADGVYVSDNGGVSFTKILDLNGASYTDLSWNHFDMSLDSVNALYGLNFTSTYVIKFQEYDNYYFAGGNDGFLFDDIDVYFVCNTQSTINPAVCDSFVAPSGAVFNTTGTHTDIIPNHLACDSIITINLTVNSTSSSISPSICGGSYVSPSANYTWTSTGTYMDTIPNAASCDSIITVNLTVNNNTSSTISPTACTSYTSPSTNYTWTSTGTYMDTIPNMSGCDSIITVNLSIQSSATSFNLTACNSYLSPSGNYTWTTSGTYVDTVSNIWSCDSIITIFLTVNNIDASVTNTSPVLTANATGVSYQWLDCDQSYAVIPGATNQSYTAMANGNYAVEVTSAGCVDTSACQTVANVGMDENDFGPDLIIYPNPTSGQLTIQTGNVYESVTVNVLNAAGQVIKTNIFNNTNNLEIEITGASGYYFIEVISSDHKKAKVKILKE